MEALWSIIANPKNRQILSWIGGAAIAVSTGAWAVVTYVWPAHESGGGVVCAQMGSIASGRDASGNTINFNGGTQNYTGRGATSCADSDKK